MARVENFIEIAAPAELVFAFFVPQRMPYWYGAEMQACFEVQGGAADFAMAQKVRITGRVGLREVGHTAVVTTCAPPNRFEWRFEDRFGVKGTERWEMERTGAPSGTGTSVRMVSEYTLPGLIGKMMDGLFTRHAVARRNRGYLRRLKHFAERGGSE